MLVPFMGKSGVAIAALASVCDAVQELEDDPTVDLPEESKKETLRLEARRRLHTRYTMKG